MSRSAAATTSTSSSCLPGASAPIATTSTRRPFSQSYSTRGEREGVTVTIMPAATHASRADPTAKACQPSRCSSSARVSACAGRRAHNLTVRQDVTAASMRNW
eukprot:scaffold325519_cov54-Tisochrysis_lutea.AAC.6